MTDTFADLRFSPIIIGRSAFDDFNIKGLESIGR